MIIALDYDGTYTTDPEFWNLFINNTKKSQHSIFIVSMRYPHETINNVDCEIIYTSRKAKSSCFHADVWIDDHPYWILKDAI